MSCEHLICAACGGIVEQARCPVCRAARAEVHRHGFAALPPALIAAIVVVVALALLLIGNHLA
jgi:Fe2+ or Zn2+ uptake regulation protein